MQWQVKNKILLPAMLSGLNETGNMDHLAQCEVQGQPLQV